MVLPRDPNQSKVVDSPKSFLRSPSGKRMTFETADGRFVSPVRQNTRSSIQMDSPSPAFRSPLSSGKAKTTMSSKGLSGTSTNAPFPMDPQGTRQASTGRRSLSPFTRLASEERRGGKIQFERTSSKEFGGLMSPHGLTHKGSRAHTNHVDRCTSPTMQSATGFQSVRSAQDDFRSSSPGGKRIASAGTKNAHSDWNPSPIRRGIKVQGGGATLVGVMKPEARAPSPVYRSVPPFATDFN